MIENSHFPFNRGGNKGVMRREEVGWSIYYFSYIPTISLDPSTAKGTLGFTSPMSLTVIQFSCVNSLST